MPDPPLAPPGHHSPTLAPTADPLADAMLPGFMCGFHEDRNRLNRRTMEDAHAIQAHFNETHGQGFFAVYDGHAGRQAAQWCGEHVHPLLASLMSQFPGTPPPELLNEAFERTDAKLAELNIHSGCTAVVSVLLVEGDRRILHTANVGDARSVLCRKGEAVRLTYDHKGSDPYEAKRVIDAGGFMMNNRVNGVLAVTRSLGDVSMKDLVVGNPYTTEIEITADDEFLILACDGVWDVMSDQEAVNLLLGLDDPRAAAELLVQQALENMSTDNLSVIVVRFVHPKRRPSHASTGMLAASAAAAAGTLLGSGMRFESEEVVFDDDATPTQRSVSNLMHTVGHEEDDDEDDNGTRGVDGVSADGATRSALGLSVSTTVDHDDRG
ncbi:phosphatase 2C-like domain-containing protein [Blastocladiella britannica]|nr:phosphatase 2C-like domain-containing protein [Blastocladiella britannica]